MKSLTAFLLQTWLLTMEFPTSMILFEVFFCCNCFIVTRVNSKHCMHLHCYRKDIYVIAQSFLQLEVSCRCAFSKDISFAFKGVFYYFIAIFHLLMLHSLQGTLRLFNFNASFIIIVSLQRKISQECDNTMFRNTDSTAIACVEMETHYGKA